MALTADESAALDMLNAFKSILDGSSAAVRKEFSKLIYTPQGQQLMAYMHGWTVAATDGGGGVVIRG